MSMAFSGALTASIFDRIAATAPVISSAVSPRTRSAIRNAPICEGVTSPDRIASNASTASALVRDAPAATLAIRGLKASITSGVVLRAQVRAEGGGEVEEVAQDGAAVFARDALRVKLDAVNRPLAMLDRHDEALVALGRHLKRVRRGRALDHQRMVARGLEGAIDAAKDAAGVMGDARGLAVHGR